MRLLGVIIDDMASILFVHGTGVRLPTYDVLLSVVRRQAAEYLPGVKVHACLWGDPHGARLHASGASIPTYAETAAPMLSETALEAVEEATWRMLAEDPLFELRILESITAETRELDPMEKSAGEQSLQMVSALLPVGDVLQFLRAKDLEASWKDAHASVTANADLERILLGANRDPREVSRVLARMLIAGMTSVSTAAGYPALPSADRERLTILLIPLLGGQPMGPLDWMMKPIAGLARNIVTRVATYRARRARRALSDETYPVAGDVIRYQSRGVAIRGFIRDRILECDDEIIVIAHSLGGIATVDLLVENDLSERVVGLVTVGSQSPFFYEIDALDSLPYGNPLPLHFPAKWLNVWDANDFLSYIGSGVFGTAVKDLEVVSGVPFPESHSAYWYQAAVWTEIREFFPWT